MYMTIHIWDFAYIDLSSTHLQCWALGRHTFQSHHQSSLYISYLQRKWAGWTPLCRGQWMWWYCHGTDTWCCHHYRKSLSDTVLFWPSLEHQGVSQLLGEGKQKNKNKKYMWLNQKKIISNHAWRKLPNMHNSNFVSIMQCTHLPNFVYTHFFRRLLQKDSEVPHQVQMLKKPTF